MIACHFVHWVKPFSVTQYTVYKKIFAVLFLPLLPMLSVHGQIKTGRNKRLKPVYGRIIDMSKPFTCVDGRKQDGAKITLHTTHKTDIIFLTFYKPNKNSNYKSIRQKWDLMGGGGYWLGSYTSLRGILTSAPGDRLHRSRFHNVFQQDSWYYSRLHSYTGL